MTAHRVLVTGAGGFLGEHLVASFGHEWEVIGAGRSAAVVSPHRWLRVGAEVETLAAAAERSKADLVVHAAFVNRKPEGLSSDAYLAERLEADLPLLEACATAARPLLLVSSSAVYGSSPVGGALSESAARRPVSLYGLAKAQQEMQAEWLHRARGLPLTTARLFNLLGPGRGSGTVAHDWIAQVAAIDRGETPPTLEVSHLAASRDFVDPRDAATALVTLAERMLSPGDSSVLGEVFNVGSGRAVSLRELSEEILGLCSVPFRIRQTDPERPVLCPEQTAEVGKLARTCDWRAELDWRDSVRDVWRQYAGRPETEPRDAQSGGR